jgi:hypothetical protein
MPEELPEGRPQQDSPDYPPSNAMTIDNWCHALNTTRMALSSRISANKRIGLGVAKSLPEEQKWLCLRLGLPNSFALVAMLWLFSKDTLAVSLGERQS